MCFILHGVSREIQSEKDEEKHWQIEDRVRPSHHIGIFLSNLINRIQETIVGNSNAQNFSTDKLLKKREKCQRNRVMDEKSYGKCEQKLNSSGLVYLKFEEVF